MSIYSDRKMAVVRLLRCLTSFDRLREGCQNSVIESVSVLDGVSLEVTGDVGADHCHFAVHIIESGQVPM